MSRRGSTGAEAVTGPSPVFEPRLTAERAARIWRETMAGQWRVVSAFDEAGHRRIVLARTPACAAIDWATLSARERVILGLAVEGMSRKAIAMELRVAPSTVSCGLRSAKGRLGFTCFAHLARAFRAAKNEQALGLAS